MLENKDKKMKIIMFVAVILMIIGVVIMASPSQSFSGNIQPKNCNTGSQCCPSP